MVALDLLSISTATAACLALLTSNVANMYQTISLVSSNNKNLDDMTPTKQQIDQIPDLNTDDTIEYMKKLSRKELMTLFLSLDAPPIKKMHGDWDGVLLDNNNWIMTKTSSFITHALFAKRGSFLSKKMWNGKSFGDNAIGVNRFFTSKKNAIQHYKNHKFDYKISPSSFFKNKSLQLSYENYQNNLSLWKSMRDEIRIVKTIRDGNSKTMLLLGMGCMQWSGGMYNAAPFCLWKSVE